MVDGFYYDVGGRISYSHTPCRTTATICFISGDLFMDVHNVFLKGHFTLTGNTCCPAHCYCNY
jgi:hypothetical protein